MIDSIVNFFKGMFFVHVRWVIRHNSKAYERGQDMMLLLITLAVPVTFLIVGVLIGMLWWKL